MNKTVILNASWLAIAAAAFFFGRSSVSTPTDETTSVRSGSKSDAVAGRPAGSGSSSGTRSKRAATRSERDSEGSGSARSGVTVAQFLNEEDSLLANKMFADLLLDLSPENAKAIFDQLVESRVDPQRVGLFLQAWGQLDGPAAMESVAALEGDGRRRALASLAVISGWAAADPDAAKAHIAGIEDGWEKAMMHQGYVSGLAKADPGAATDYVLELASQQQEPAEGDQRRDDRWRGFAFDRQLDEIANVQLRRGIPDATSWAEGLPEGTVKAAAFDRVAEKFASEDPEGAAAWIQNHAGNEYAERGLREVAEEMARKDPAAAVTWIEGLPEDSQARAMSETLNRWTREDPVAAGEYLTAMPESQVRDSAVSSFARELDREDPQIAARWASSISNEEMRNETLSSVARSWLRSNPEEAKQWLPGSGLSAEAQQNALQDAERGRGREGDGRGRGR